MDYFNIKRVSKNKIIVISVIIALLWVFWLAMFIYTSWYENDVLVTKAIGEVAVYKAPVLWTLADYIVYDGNFVLCSITIPLGIILFESFLLYFKKAYPQKQWLQNFYANRRIFGYVLMSAWTIALGLAIYFVGFSDYGFGVGFTLNFEGLIWNIVAGVLIFVLNNVITWTVGILVMYRLTIQKDFLENEYWKRALFFAVFVILMYLIISILKLGFQRPSYAATTWSDQLEWLKEHNFERWENYMNQNWAHYGLWIPGSHAELSGGYINDAFKSLEGSYPWYKPNPSGWFYSGPSNPYFIKEEMFPSGHIETSIALVVGMGVYAFPKKPGKTLKLQRGLGYTLTIGYLCGMVLGLGFSLIYGHWMNDIAFTFVLAGVMIFAVKGVTDLLLKYVFYPIDRKIMNRAQK